MSFECFEWKLFEISKRYAKPETMVQKDHEERIPNHIQHVQIEHKISFSQ